MQKIIATLTGTQSYSIYGKGEPILLLHGFAEDSRIWNEQVNFLKNNYQLIVPDLRGSGASIIGSKPTSVEDFADDIKQILDAENISTCIMLGHSMGGYITLAFAEKYPASLHAFGLIHSSAYADNKEKKEARLKSISFIEEHDPFEFIKTTIPKLFAESFNQQHTKKVEELVEQGKQFSKEALIAYYKAMINRPDRTQVLRKATMPVLFFIGEEDKAVNPQDAIEQSSLPLVCKVKLVKGIAHMGMLEATDELNECIDEFIKTVQQLKKHTSLV